MEEQFLHYLWKFRLLNLQLRLLSGEPLTVLHPGVYNHDGGPDFFNARIRIGQTTWAGNVEIHGKASDWYRHGHHRDKAYDNIVLHVVYESDQEVKTSDSHLIPTLELKQQYPAHLLSHYQNMMTSHQWIPCYALLKDLNKQELSVWMTVLALERLKKKSETIYPLWDSCGKDWKESFYRFMSLNFGFRINALPFELLAKALPFKVMTRQGYDLFLLESLLYGMSGLILPGVRDDYPKALKREFDFFREKYQLQPISSGLWKFLRLRPGNFPTIRLSEWAAFLHHHQENLFDFLLENDLEVWRKALSVKASVYWNEHFIFDKKSAYKPKILGESSINLLIVNALLPFLFFYSRQKSVPTLSDRALQMLDLLPAENNRELSLWKNGGIATNSALDTQALIQLKRTYCDFKRCLECRIGHQIMKNKTHEKNQLDQGLPLL